MALKKQIHMSVLPSCLPFLVYSPRIPQSSAIISVPTYQKFPEVVRLCLVSLLEFPLIAIAVSCAKADPVCLLPSPTPRVGYELEVHRLGLQCLKSSCC